MTSIYEMFETHDKPITLNFGVNSQGEQMTMDIAHVGENNIKFKKAMERLMAPFRALKIGDIPEQDIRRIMRRAYAEGVVLSWTGFRDKQGQVIDLTVDNAVNLFNDLPALFIKVQEAATDASNFRAALLEADAGN